MRMVVRNWMVGATARTELVSLESMTRPTRRIHERVMRDIARLAEDFSKGRDP